MALNNLAFDPVTGLADATVYTDPTSESQTREQLNSLHLQTRDYINNTLVPAVLAIEGATGSQTAIDEIESRLATVLAALDNYAPLASPALTGTPTAPTADTSTNTTQVATTAFVKSAIAVNNITQHDILIYASEWLTGAGTGYVGYCDKTVGVDFTKAKLVEFTFTPTDLASKDNITDCGVFLKSVTSATVMQFMARDIVPTMNINVRIIAIW